MKADIFAKTAPRTETLQAVSLLGAMSGIAIPIGVTAANSAGDVTVGIVAAALTALLLISLLQMFGVLGSR